MVIEICQYCVLLFGKKIVGLPDTTNPRFLQQRNVWEINLTCIVQQGAICTISWIYMAEILPIRRKNSFKSQSWVMTIVNSTITFPLVETMILTPPYSLNPASFFKPESFKSFYFKGRVSPILTQLRYG